WGAMQSRADLIAFLDADDAYQANALLPVIAAFHFLPFLSLVRLKLTPVDLATRYAQHPDLAKAWDILQMTVGGNMIFRRNLFLASGGFPQDDLFRTLGGEDVSLGIAFAETTAVGTLFAEHDAGVLHYCRDGMHAERLLDAYLFQQHDPRITPEAQQYAAQTTQRIKQNLQTLMPILQHGKAGRTPLTMQFE
ncbi:MAG: glycosyltransferase family A protein, partial [Acinetobacter sp.]|nr:glycosyltransferase family A protein [Acinetobacter sp.]